MNIHGVTDVRQTEMHLTATSAFEVEMAIEKPEE
jgi:hypothetical protein